MPTLTWLNKDQAITAAKRSAYRLLEEVPELSYGDENNENLLIQGDNLEALKALIPFYAGKVKCIYIDPPFNTGAAFVHYDDNLENSIWLTILYPRLEILHSLLAHDGTLLVHIDDKQDCHLRLVLDEIFGRKNFLNRFVVKTSDPSGHKTVNPSPYSQTEYIFLYAKNRGSYVYEPHYVEDEYDTNYGQLIANPNDEWTQWRFTGLNQFIAEKNNFKDTREARKEMGRAYFDGVVAEYALKNADRVCQLVRIADDAGAAIVEARDASLDQEDLLRVRRKDSPDVYIYKGRQVYFYRSKLRNLDGREVPTKLLTNLWYDIPWNGISREGQVSFPKLPLNLTQHHLSKL